MALLDVVRQYTLAHWPYGIAFDGKNIWYTRTIGLEAIYCLDRWTGAIIRSHTFPASNANYVCFDGKHLWMVDEANFMIRCVDPYTLEFIRSFASPATHPAGITFDGKHLWHIDGRLDSPKLLHCIDPYTGALIDTINLSWQIGELDYNIEDITFDGKNFWISHDDDALAIPYISSYPPGEIWHTIEVPLPDDWLIRGITFDGKYLWNTARSPAPAFHIQCREIE